MASSNLLKVAGLQPVLSLLPKGQLTLLPKWPLENQGLLITGIDGNREQMQNEERRLKKTTG